MLAFWEYIEYNILYSFTYFFVFIKVVVKYIYLSYMKTNMSFITIVILCFAITINY